MAVSGRILDRGRQSSRIEAGWRARQELSDLTWGEGGGILQTGAEGLRHSVKGRRPADRPGPMFKTTLSGKNFAAAYLRVTFPVA